MAFFLGDVNGEHANDQLGKEIGLAGKQWAEEHVCLIPIDLVISLTSENSGDSRIWKCTCSGCTLNMHVLCYGMRTVQGWTIWAEQSKGECKIHVEMH